MNREQKVNKLNARLNILEILLAIWIILGMYIWLALAGVPFLEKSHDFLKPFVYRPYIWAK